MVQPRKHEIGFPHPGAPQDPATVLIHPLFAAALGKEFIVATDPMGGPRTLGLIAYAAYQEGIEVGHPDVPPLSHGLVAGRAFAAGSYGPGIVAAALCVREGTHDVIKGVHLRDGKTELTVYNDHPSGQPGLVLASGRENPHMFRLRQGPELEAVQLAVAAAAETFYQRQEG